MATETPAVEHPVALAHTAHRTRMHASFAGHACTDPRRVRHGTRRPLVYRRRFFFSSRLTATTPYILL